MEEVKKLRAERQVADALNMRNGPKTTAIHNLPLNSPVLVWREGPIGLQRPRKRPCINPITYNSTSQPTPYSLYYSYDLEKWYTSLFTRYFISLYTISYETKLRLLYQSTS